MTPEQWQRVKEVFQAAAERDPGQRGAFLDQVCGGDPSLRAEVEALLASDEQSASFIEAPVFEVAPELLADDRAVLPVGQAIGHCQILSKLGAGGMGEVYLAQDTTLGRKVALKVLTPALVADNQSRTRFLREARLASALDHANICTVHEISEADGHHFISMQYVEGETLKRVIGHRPLSLQRLLSISLQVADALRAAHAQGIIHRDIKSNNIMITQSESNLGQPSLASEVPTATAPHRIHAIGPSRVKMSSQRASGVGRGAAARPLAIPPLALLRPVPARKSRLQK